MKSATIGPARNRVDGRLKVTGAAKYAVEFDVPNCAYAWPVDSTIAKGTISAIDTEAARAVPGVLAVLTHQNAPKLSNPPKDTGQTGIRNEERLPLSDATVYYAGQYVALVVAQSAEQARYAASLVRVTYARQSASLTMDEARASAERPEENNGDEVQIAKGDVDATLRDPQLVKIEQTYVTPAETHNPIEMSGTIAAWSGDTLTNLRRDAIRERRAAHRRRVVRDRCGQRARDLPVRRRCVRLQGRGLAARAVGRDGGKERRRTGEAAHLETGHVHRHRSSHTDATTRRACRHARRANCARCGTSPKRARLPLGSTWSPAARAPPRCCTTAR
jgi:hypothetical protein